MAPPAAPPPGAFEAAIPSPGVIAQLLRVLARARDLGFLGPGPVEDQLAHGLAMAGAVQEAPRRFADLGSGGGVPALVLLARWPESEAALIEAGERRSRFLSDACQELGWSGRTRVVAARAEEVGRDPAFRGLMPLVTARSFGPPAVTAECGAPLLRPGGTLLVSEPPEVRGRWPAAALAELGLEGPGQAVEVAGYHFRQLRQVRRCPERYPRRTGVPSRRPLFGPDPAED